MATCLPAASFTLLHALMTAGDVGDVSNDSIGQGDVGDVSDDPIGNGDVGDVSDDSIGIGDVSDVSNDPIGNGDVGDVSDDPIGNGDVGDVSDDSIGIGDDNLVSYIHPNETPAERGETKLQLALFNLIIGRPTEPTHTPFAAGEGDCA